MREIRTRPKERERKHTYTLPKQAVKTLQQQALRRKMMKRELDKDAELRDTPVQETVQRFETSAEKAARLSSRTAFRVGKQAAKEQFDRRNAPSSRKENSQPGDSTAQPESPQKAQVRQEFQRTRQRKHFRQTQTKRREAHQNTSAASTEVRQETHRRTEVAHTSLFHTPSTTMLPEEPIPKARFIQPEAPQKPASQITFPVTTPKQKKEHQSRLFLNRVTSSRTMQTGPGIQRGLLNRQAQRRTQERAVQESIKKRVQTAKNTAQRTGRVKQAALRAGKAIVRAAVGLLGGAGALIALVLVIGGAAAAIGTPFGVFWSGNDSDAQSVPQTVAQINGEFSTKISQIQADHPADSVVIHRIPDGGSSLTIMNWTDVIAVFAVKTAGAGADATDVVTIDEKRIELIRLVFWDMNEISSHVQTIKQEDSTERILHITITSKYAEDMADVYDFSHSQREALTEILKPEYAQMLAELVGTYGGEMELTEEQIRDMIAAMPEDISLERRAVVEKAYSLLGKVNYFWGGKSRAIGWDSRWGTPTRVTVPGSRTTGTIRRFGLDCSGFVDWVFNNALNYVIGHGGGAHAQHTYCTPISWSEALPGDLVFYPGDSHVGVFVGKDATGDPLIIHCASSQNNVVLTGLQGFTSIGRPVYYCESKPRDKPDV